MCVCVEACVHTSAKTGEVNNVDLVLMAFIHLDVTLTFTTHLNTTEYQVHLILANWPPNSRSRSD